MRVTIVSDTLMPTPTPQSGGLQRCAYDMARALIERGHTVTLVGAQGSYCVGARVIQTVPPSLSNSPDTEAENAKAALATEYDVLLDVSHTHQAAYRDPSRSVIWHQDTTVLAPHKRVVCISEAQRKRVAEKCEAVVVRNAILPPAFTADWAKIGPDAPREHRMLFLGNLVPHKGAHLAIEVARRADWPLWVAGPPLDRRYAERVMSMCTGDITYIGPLSELEKYRCLSQVKLVICCPNASYIGYSETGQLVVAEAAFCGTGVVASANGCMPEYVPKAIGRTGATLSDIVEATNRMMCHFVGADQRHAIRRYFDTHYDLRGVMDRWENILSA